MISLAQDSKKMDHKPPLEMRDSGISGFTPSPPPKKSLLPRSSGGSARSMHRTELQHRRPSREDFNQNIEQSPDELHQEMIVPPRLDLSSIIGDNSDSDISSSDVVSTDRTSQSLDDFHPELAINTPSTDPRTKPASWGVKGYQSDIDSLSPSPAPSVSSSPGSMGYQNLRRSQSGELEDESEGSILKVKLKLKQARPPSGSEEARKRKFTVTKVKTPPLLLNSSKDLSGNDQAYKQSTDAVMRSKYTPLPGIGSQGIDQTVSAKEGIELGKKQPMNDQSLVNPALESTSSLDKDIREQRIRALEHSTSQGEISRKVPVPPPQSAKTVSRRAMRMQQFARRKSASQAEAASRQGSRTSVSCKSVLLAIRLPSGSRIQNLFDETQSLQTVVQFALKQGECSLDISNVCLVTNDMPKRELKDLSQTIEDVGLADRTLLNLEELD